jgi:hypothetical protein
MLPQLSPPGHDVAGLHETQVWLTQYGVAAAHWLSAEQLV